MTIKKAKMIETIIKSGSVWKSAYGYVLNENDAIEKVYHGSNKRETYATVEEVGQVRFGMEERRKAEEEYSAWIAQKNND